MWLFAQHRPSLRIMLQAQSSRDLNLWQACQEIGKKSSKIVPLGAPLPGCPHLINFVLCQ
jgi:hypothetical protein